ncbi:MAG: CehA/McbA family metallohydrolase, partial [Bryobacteraceae bacterium]
DASPRTLTFRLERWIDPAKLGWYSGDHHIHAAGCAHYERPTEGVYPKDMMRHVMGEDLKIGSVLTWGPGWYFQKTFFEGKDNPLSTPEHRIRYDVEVSGHPSSHTGHLLLLRLKEQDYPGTKRIEDWPSWGLPILQWGKQQGAITGYTHSGWGLAIPEEKLLSYAMPPFDGIGANEYVVTVTHGAPDIISAVDTPYHWELNVWYHALNVGYRTRISGETDFPCIYGERVGLGRSYVRQAKLDYDDWVSGLKEGRNYASDGKSHLIDFRVNGVEMGSGKDVVLSSSGKVTVAARVAAWLDEQPDESMRRLAADKKPYWDVERARIASTRRVPVELVVNGQAVARQEIDADGSLGNVTFLLILIEAVGSAFEFFPRRIRIRSGSRWAMSRSGPQSEVRSGCAKQ